jgi:hypothetical protein
LKLSDRSDRSKAEKQINLVLIASAPKSSKHGDFMGYLKGIPDI